MQSLQEHSANEDPSPLTMTKPSANEDPSPLTMIKSSANEDPSLLTMTKFTFTGFLLIPRRNSVMVWASCRGASDQWIVLLNTSRASFRISNVKVGAKRSSPDLWHQDNTSNVGILTHFVT